MDFSGKWKLQSRTHDEEDFLRILGVSEFKIKMNSKASEVQYITHFYVDNIHIIQRLVRLKAIGIKHDFATYEQYDGKSHDREDGNTTFGKHQCKSVFTNYNEGRIINYIHKNDSKMTMLIVRTLLDINTMQVVLTITGNGKKATCTKVYIRDKLTSTNDFNVMKDMAKGKESCIYK